MNFLERCLRRPQSVWLRRALFQVHLWAGLILGLYVIAICVSGSAVVYRLQLDKTFAPAVKTVPISGPRLTVDQMKQAAMRVHPGYVVDRVEESTKPNLTTDVLMDRGWFELQHQFDPYTGQDLGRSVPVSYEILEWTVQFHGNLQSGSDGQELNGIGGLCLAVVALTGMVIWWPGISSWKRSLTIGWRGSWKQFNWGLHSAFGIWALFFVFMWGFTGAYLVYPEPFERTINHFSPLLAYQAAPPGGFPASFARAPQYAVGSWQRRIYGRRQLGFGDKLLRWFTLLHFGRFAGNGVGGNGVIGNRVVANGLMILWMILGLVPPVLFVTGALMWWNRVLSPYLHRIRLVPSPSKPAPVYPESAEGPN